MTAADQPAILDGAADAARRDAQTAASAAGVEIREMTLIYELEAVSVLLSQVWNRTASGRIVPTDLLKALSKSRNYIAGCFLDGRLVGATVSFFALPAMNTLHSHITGVIDRQLVPGAGYALKLHQRAWALAHDVETVTWTFDPLVRRNAHFNFTKLGVRAAEYLPNFYGAMQDDLNTGDSDRLLVAWEMDAEAGAAEAVDGPAPEPALTIADDGRPRVVPCSGPRRLLAVPPDIEQIRIESPQLAQEWRLALRDTLGTALAAGGRVAGFLQHEGYVIEAGAA